MLSTVGSARRKASTASTIRGLITPRLEGHAVTKLPPFDARPPRRGFSLSITFPAGLILVALLFGLLLGGCGRDTGAWHGCKGHGTWWARYTCVPYTGTVPSHPATNPSGSSVRPTSRPQAPKPTAPKAPTVKAPAVKAPAAPPKPPAAPPRVSLRK
ncbi:hypothetical protein ACIBAC_00740 [Streptomyces sp. NPDC051362]|uniref:hypothetical protein n=1 Tax=Streptomyces sp. NPDC051362 TaxID=3365651 RepID=UPI0037A3C4C0